MINSHGLCIQQLNCWNHSEKLEMKGLIGEKKFNIVDAGLVACQYQLLSTFVLKWNKFLIFFSKKNVFLRIS